MDHKQDSHIQDEQVVEDYILYITSPHTLNEPVQVLSSVFHLPPLPLTTVTYTVLSGLQATS